MLFGRLATNQPSEFADRRGQTRAGIGRFWDRLSGLLQTRCRKPFAALSGHVFGTGFGTVEILISTPSDFVPKLTVLETVTPQTAANDGQDVCTLESPIPPGSSSQRKYADSSYTPPPLPPQICQSIPITAPVPCPSLVRPPQSSSSPSANSSVADLRSETPSVSPAAPSDVRVAVPFRAPLLRPPTAYSPSNVPASAPPSSCPSASHFAAPILPAGSLPDSPPSHRTGSSCSRASLE